MSKITGKVNYKEVLKGDTGYTFEPHVTVDGILYWSNNGNLENPLPVNIKGKNGDMVQEEEINSLNNEINNLNKHKIDYINIKEYKKYVQNDDWTIAISTALNDLDWGGTLYFPIGDYKHKGILINKSCNLKGCSKTSTKLINISDNDSILICENVERGSFSDIAIFGDWEQNKNHKGNGIVFSNNSVCWNFDNIWMRFHGGDFFYACDNGHVNNINIKNSEFEYGGKNCMVFYQTNYNNQINAINIENCNISNFKENGFDIWGQSINISKCTIQYCRNKGINIDAFKYNEKNLAQSHSQSINIKDNYFELCYNGFISINCGANEYSRYINSIVIKDNFGSYGIIDTDENLPMDKSVNIVEIRNNQYSQELHMISGLEYKNAFSVGSSNKVNKIINVFGLLDYTNTIYINYIGADGDYNELYNCSLALVKNYNQYVNTLFGNRCINKKFNLIENVDEIKTNDHIFWDFSPLQANQINNIKVFIETDANDYTISPCFLVDNEPFYYEHFRNNTGNKEFSLKFSADSIKKDIDAIGFRVLLNSDKTFFKIKNPKIFYSL